MGGGGSTITTSSSSSYGGGGGGGGGLDGAYDNYHFCTPPPSTVSSSSFGHPHVDRLVLPPPLRPLPLPFSSSSSLLSSSSSNCRCCVLLTPFSLYGLFLLLASLFVSHLLSRTPLTKLGHIGKRGRKYHGGWNESTTGDCGGRVWDWWLFGGCVYVRAYRALQDAMMFGTCDVDDDDDDDDYDEAGGGDATEEGVEGAPSRGRRRHRRCKWGIGSRFLYGGGGGGIWGYDTSLGAHGPVLLAMLRQSVLLLTYASICSFAIMTHDELYRWTMIRERSSPTMLSPNGDGTTMRGSTIAYLAMGILRCIVMGGTSTMPPRDCAASAIVDANRTVENGILFIQTITHASMVIVVMEIGLYVFGTTMTRLEIYVPKGVSHPGGPRVHKIRRMPKWRGGEEHYLPKKLLSSSSSVGRWRCAVGHDSHRDTDTKFGINTTNEFSGLSGEPYGRQIWTTSSPMPRAVGTEGGVDEDDLDDALRMEFPPMSTRSRKKLRDGNAFTEGAGSGEGGGGSSKSSDGIGTFLQNLLKPDRRAHIPTDEEQRGRSGGGGGVIDRDGLIEVLSSGGRRPLAFDPSTNPNSSDQIFRAQMISSYLDRTDGKLPDDISYLHLPSNDKSTGDGGDDESDGCDNRPKSAMEAARRGIAFYSMLQTPDGHFAGDYGGPHFLLPGLVVAWYVMGRPSVMISDSHRDLMMHYLMVHQQEDGGWGTHIESPSTMFGTVICYLAVRLLGGKKDDEWIRNGRDFIQREGGAVMTSSWAKFWLCLVGCMDWKGHNSVPPEMWLLPNWFPFHPGRLWCHCRMVYLPMGYLYGSRFIYSHAETDPLISELREELYCEPYDSIQWDSTRHLVADMDNYSPIPAFMKFAQNCLSFYENWTAFRPFRDAVRKAGLKFCLEYMKAEDLQTNYVDIGPVNKALNMVSAFYAANNDINDEAVRNHMMRVADYLWVAEDGMKMQGYNGSQCWDTSFAIQAVWECGLLDEFPHMSTKVWAYLERTQILSTDTSRSSPAYQFESPDYRDKFYRHVSKGGWPFSTSAHGWPISDCTGEGLKGVLALMDSPLVMGAVKKGLLKGIEPCRLYDAVNVILTLQNEDGGWATYENNRGFGWYEELNPSEVFGDIMIDYSYVECSMASLSALAEFHEKFPHHRTQEITFAIHRGADFIKSIQREDGSWYGSWACCFCYGCWFGIEGLIKAGESHKSSAIQKCCEFLLSQQRPNGGWGEDFTSCYDKDYAEKGMQSYGDDGSGVVSTAWALLALSEAKCSDAASIRKGVLYLMKRQLECGDWPQEGISGVFNRACGITYTAYRNVFPIWALGRCSKFLGEHIWGSIATRAECDEMLYCDEP